MDPENKQRYSMTQVSRKGLPEARRDISLDDRDRELLLALGKTRVLTRKQAARLLKISGQGLHKRLVKLYEHRCVDLVMVGRTYHIFCLDALGIEYVAQETGIAREKLRSRTRTLSAFFLDHYLEVAEAYVSVTMAAVDLGAGVSLAWWNEVEASDHYKLRSGKPCKLGPDAVFSLIGAEIVDTMVFLEVDRATESLQQWKRKMEEYNTYLRSRRILDRWEPPPRLLLLVVAPDPRRVRTLRRWTKRLLTTGLEDTQLLLRFATPKCVQADRVMMFLEIAPRPRLVANACRVPCE